MNCQSTGIGALQTGAIVGSLEVDAEAARLVCDSPLRRRAVVVVGVGEVVVHVETGQHRAAARTAHRRRHERVGERRAGVAQPTLRLRHVAHRPYGTRSRYSAGS